MTLDQFISRIRVASTVKELDWLATKLPSFGEAGEAAVVALLTDDDPRIFGNAGAVLGGAHYVATNHPVTMNGIIKQLDHPHIEAQRMVLPVLIAEMMHFANDDALAALHAYVSKGEAQKDEFVLATDVMQRSIDAWRAIDMARTGTRG